MGGSMTRMCWPCARHCDSNGENGEEPYGAQLDPEIEELDDSSFADRTTEEEQASDKPHREAVLDPETFDFVDALQLPRRNSKSAASHRHHPSHDSSGSIGSISGGGLDSAPSTSKRNSLTAWLSGGIFSSKKSLGGSSSHSSSSGSSVGSGLDGVGGALLHNQPQKQQQQHHHHNLLSITTGKRHSKNDAVDVANGSAVVGAFSNEEDDSGLTHVKMLMCGSGESGKSTVVKQMKILYGGGFSSEEVADFRTQIYRNVHEAMLNILQHLNYSVLTRDDQTLAAVWNVRRFKPENFESLSSFPSTYVDAVVYLWVELIRSSFDDLVRLGHARESTAHFLDHFERIGKEGYVPTNEDILMARIKTVGINEFSFTTGNLAIHMVDVGGQRPEREKWIETFDGVNTLVFCAALSEYDQMLAEEPTQNRLIEAYQLWEAVVNSKWFANTSIVLFLNKKDLFRRKLTIRDFDLYHPGYYRPEGVNTLEEMYQDVADYIRGQFLKLNHGRAKVYCYYTCATDTHNIAAVFTVVKERILAINLSNAGIL